MLVYFLESDRQNETIYLKGNQIIWNMCAKQEFPGVQLTQ